MVLGGDLRQTLPVVEMGERAEIVQSCVTRSNVWMTGLVRAYALTDNIRAALDENFRNFVLSVGDGSAPYDLEHGKNCIRLPPELSLPPSARTSLELVRLVYDDVIAAAERAIADPCKENLQQLALRAVLTLRNEHVRDLNEAVLAGFPAESIHTLPCATTIQGGTREDYATYPVDCLNSLDLPGLPPAALRLCRGAIVVLLRNVDYEGGLCNGARALIIKISPRVLDVLLLSGRCAGQRTFLSRIPMSPSDYVLPVKLVRRQFPLRLAWIMTINRAQG